MSIPIFIFHVNNLLIVISTGFEHFAYLPYGSCVKKSKFLAVIFYNLFLFFHTQLYHAIEFIKPVVIKNQQE